MIHYKVPKVDYELLNKARAHTSINEEEKKEVYDKVIKRHGPAMRREDNWDQRKAEIEDLVDLGYYLKETRANEPEYQSYISTLDKMLNKKGLIISKSANLPMRQFTSMTVELLVYEAINKSQYKIDIEIPEQEEGKQDHGVDLTMKRSGSEKDSMPFDIKTTYMNEPVNQHSSLGKIKDHALTDKKETEYILWVGDNFKDGYITIKGREKWEDVKDSINNKTGWTSREYLDSPVFNPSTRQTKPLKLHDKKMLFVDKTKLLDLEFIGDFPASLKAEIMEKSQWLEDEYSIRETRKENILELKRKVDIITKLDPTNLRDAEASSVDKLLGLIYKQAQDGRGVAGLNKLASKLMNFREIIEHPITDKFKAMDDEMKRVSSKIEIISETRRWYQTPADKKFIRDSSHFVNKYAEVYYDKIATSKTLARIELLGGATKSRAKENGDLIKISMDEKKEIRREKELADHSRDH